MTDQNPLEQSDKPFYGWKNAGLLAFIYMVVHGLVSYGFSVIFPVMIHTMGWSRGDASWAPTIAGLIAGIFAPVAAFFINKMGSRKTIIIGLFMLVTGLLLLSTVTTKLWHWFVIWGVIIPIARNLCGLFPIQVSVINWFNVKRATVLGLVMSTAGFSGAMAQPIYTRIMQIIGTWQIGWAISASFAFIGLIISFWIRSKPSDLGQYPDGVTPGEGIPSEGTKQSGARTFKTQDTWTVGESFKTRTLWFYIIINILHILPIVGLINIHGVLHLTDVGYTAMQASTVLAAITFASGMARFPMGWIGDRVEPRWLVTIAMCCMILGFISFWTASSFHVLIVLGPFIGFGFGSMLVLMPIVQSNYYGLEPFASIRGCIAPFITVFVAGCPPIAGYLADKYGTYDRMFAVLAGGLAISLIISLFLSPPKKAVEKKLGISPV